MSSPAKSSCTTLFDYRTPEELESSWLSCSPHSSMAAAAAVHTVLLGEVYKDKTSSKKSEYKRHVRSLFRFTYRRDFPALDPYAITSDAGWGCMLRVSQMLMATALQRHMLGREWRRGVDLASLQACAAYTTILRSFLDRPGPPHVYAIHHLAQCGIKYDKLPGEWFGPSTAALVLRDLAKLHRTSYGGSLEVLIAEGDTIYVSEAERICCGSSGSSSSGSSSSGSSTSSSRGGSGVATATTEGEQGHEDARKDGTAAAEAVAGGTKEAIGGETIYDPLLNPAPASLPPWSCALMVCIPLRLGISSVSAAYVQELQAALRHPCCLGFIGGRENHAIYFVGYRQAQGSGPEDGRDGESSSSSSSNSSTLTPTTFLGLDPHTVFPAAPPDALPFPPPELVAQVHVDELDTLDATRLDPSLALAFYFRTREEFTQFCDDTRATAERKKQAAAVAAGGAGKRVAVRPALYAVQVAPPANYDDIDVGASSVPGRECSGGDAGSGGGGGGGEGSNDDDDEYILV